MCYHGFLTETQACLVMTLGVPVPASPGFGSVCFSPFNFAFISFCHTKCLSHSANCIPAPRESVNQGRDVHSLTHVYIQVVTERVKLRAQERSLSSEAQGWSADTRWKSGDTPAAWPGRNTHWKLRRSS